MNDSVSPPKNRQWNYQPPLPVKVSPLFRLPWNLFRIVSWFLRSWLPVSEKMIILLLALASWWWFHPTLVECTEFSWSWVSLIYLRNLILIFLVAGGLHAYFYVFKFQGKDRQYDARPFARNKRSFTFNNQVWDNMFWSCASGVTIWSAYEVLLMWSMANGYIPSLPETNTLVWVALLVFLIPIWETFYFYLIHRLLHWPPLYRKVHALHHRNTNIGPWSGLSMHPVEHVIYLGSVLIHFVVPANPLIVIYHLQFFTLSAATTHCGFEGISTGGENRLPLGTYHHQLHHRYFECNYGGLEIPWDKWLGSFHDGTAESHKAFQDRRMAQQAGKAN